MGAEEVLNKIKHALKESPPLDKILKFTSLGCGIFFIIVCAWLIVTTLITFQLATFIVSLYLIIGGVMIVLGELNIAWYINKLNFMGNHFGRGVFYFYIGSLVFAVFGLDGVLAIVLTVGGIIMMVLGIVQIVYHFAGDFLQTKFNSSSSGGREENLPLTSNNKGTALELQDPNFDPNIYATTYVTIDDNKPSFDDVSNPAQYGLSSPRY